MIGTAGSADKMELAKAHGFDHIAGAGFALAANHGRAFRDAPQRFAEIARAGADTFVAGSAIFGQADYAAVIAAMKQAVSAH